MRRLRSRSVLIGAVGCVVVTAFGYVFGAKVELAFASVLYLLLIMVVAWQARLRTAVATAVWATLCLDFFFTQPKHNLRIVSLADFWSLTAFASVALFVSHLSNRIRDQAEDLRTQQRRQRALYQLSTAALSLDWKNDFVEHLAALVRETIHANGIVIWTARDDRAVTSGSESITPDSIRASFKAGRSYDLPRTDTYIRLLKSGMRDIGLLWISVPNLDPLMADSIAPIVASALERARALSNEVAAQSEQLSEVLRTSVLDGLAHAFKTPLTTIAVASAGLAEIPDIPQEQRADLANIIRKEAERLNEITQQVLRTARLEWDKVLSLTEVEFSRLINDVVHSLGSEAQMRIRITSEHPNILVADPGVLKIAFEQILENALKYSEAGSEIFVNVSQVEGMCSTSIHNTGSFIEAEEQERIFTRFYRSPSMSYRAMGTGIGLSVARHAVEAHNGRIVVQSDPHTGTTFRVDLPVTGENQ